jgi:L-threonylcarbamoyladenylate synthase
MIFNKKDNVPYETTAGLDTVAIRFPSHPIALALITNSNCPIAAPSANSSGRPSTTDGSHVLEDLNGKIDAIIDCGRSEIGLESTVLDLTSAVPTILRPGGTSFSQLSKYIPDLQTESESTIKSAPKAPGMKYKHYAPKGHLTIYHGSTNQVIEAINDATIKAKKQGYVTGVIATTEYIDAYSADIILDIGPEKDSKVIASNLFRILRKMDELNVDYISTRSISENDIGLATMNRLLKAAGNNLIEL